VRIPDDAEQTVVAFTRNAPPAMMASMAHDLIRGNRIELPWLSGKVVALGRELGVPTPVHEILYAVLKPFTEGKSA
jgi:2-dehydropantoate 2-reductase